MKEGGRRVGGVGEMEERMEGGRRKGWREECREGGRDREREGEREGMEGDEMIIYSDTAYIVTLTHVRTWSFVRQL